ncbi:MAG TPA: OsmC family protein [Candidatus Eisenbacteria bacterium]|nr:OsmC family protein [Candidatus Eisenbacteria bacterium]
MSAPSNRHEFPCRLVWTGAAKGGSTSYETYSRDCRVDFPGKPSIRGTSAPAFRGDPAITNPEDLLVASISMCHFLSYVAICARKGVNVIAYDDDAVGTMDRVEKTFKFTDVLLKPHVTIAPGSDPELARTIHERAHQDCFISNSVNFPVRHEPVITVAAPV